jgi:AhpD family alkylhydroperoxidase
MPRIPAKPYAEWAPELRALVDPDAVTPLQLAGTSILAQAPHMALANFAFASTAASGQRLSACLVELVRLRIAFHNQCRSCMAMRYETAMQDGLTEDMICSLERPMDAENLTEREKAALAYADLFATNHHAIDDAAIARLSAHFDAGEIVELGMFAGYFLGLGRFLASLDIVEELPEDMKDKSKAAAPWITRAAVVVRK